MLLEDRFELPPGFSIYRAAGPELSGGSYALTFDGEGRLLVGDGTAVRRLTDQDNDGVFDRFDVIATGLGWRGPQGLLVDGDRLYAVGGDGLQWFEGYCSGGTLTPRGRVGNRLQTGGDHDAHTVLRGLDGWLYFMVGNGAGLTNRMHITETNSPALFEREASVFRISPDGRRWECLGTGGRNPPNLGMNSLGELFSFDSDMEWHVGLPWYRPVRLNHWAIGGDQGWQEVGAFPPYYPDNLPGVLEVGRGSPTWGVFYEHQQLPEKYRDAFLVCDYRWKRESNDQYATPGRLVAFFLRRAGAGWQASMETVVRPRPGARDADGKLINFALVEVAVAPDGSLVVSDHNQGIWRIFYDSSPGRSTKAPPLLTAWPSLGEEPGKWLAALLELPQPASERTRLREALLRDRLGARWSGLLQRVALDDRTPHAQRLRAIRLLGPDFAQLPEEFLRALARQAGAEIRGQAAWLLGIRGGKEAWPPLRQLLRDQDPFVRRRAAEAATRLGTPAATPALLERMSDPDRLVRYVAMNALAHRPTAEWFDQAIRKSEPQTRLRALVAAWLRREPPAEEKTRRAIRALLSKGDGSRENQLDLLRVLALYRKSIEPDTALRNQVVDSLLQEFPGADREVRWEKIRLLGEYQAPRGFGLLLGELVNEPDPVTQFHIAQALSLLPGGWTAAEEQDAVHWLLGTQRGWFAEFADKGVEFPQFWATALAQFGTHHRKAFLRTSEGIDFTGLLGQVVLNLMAQPPAMEVGLIALYQTNRNTVVRLRVLQALQGVRSSKVDEFLLAEHDQLDWNVRPDAALGGAILQAWATHPNEETLPYLVYEGLFHEDPQVVRACAAGLAREVSLARSFLEPGPAGSGKKGDEAQAELARDIISRMMERPQVARALENVLALWSSQQRPEFKPRVDLDRGMEKATHAAAMAFWQQWFADRFHEKFKPVVEKEEMEKSDEEVRQFLMSDAARRGDAARGSHVYEALQCQTCHGGGVTPGREGRLFGPDLAGVTRRLTPEELADAIVYPSKQVADRFKAMEISLKDTTTFTGFLTEQTAESITLVDREQVRRIPRSDVRSMSSLSASLMPERLLNRLSWAEMSDLLAFLEDIGAGGK